MRPHPSTSQSSGIRLLRGHTPPNPDRAGTSRCHSGEIPTAAAPKTPHDNGYPCVLRAGSGKLGTKATSTTTITLGVTREREKKGSCRAHRCCRSPATVASYGFCCADELLEGFVGTSRLLSFGKVFNGGVTGCQLWLLMRCFKTTNSCYLHAVLTGAKLATINYYYNGNMSRGYHQHISRKADQVGKNTAHERYSCRFGDATKGTRTSNVNQAHGNHRLFARDRPRKRRNTNP